MNAHDGRFGSKPVVITHGILRQHYSRFRKSNAGMSVVGGTTDVTDGMRRWLEIAEARRFAIDRAVARVSGTEDSLNAAVDL